MDTIELIGNDKANLTSPQCFALTGGMPQCFALTGGMPQCFALTGGMPQCFALTGGMPQCFALTGGMPQERSHASVGGFTVHDEGSANWYLGKLAGIEAEKARLKVQYDKRIAELTSDAKSLTHQFGSEFETWARAEADRRRRKTVTLQQGSISFRDVPGRFTFKTGADEEAFVHARTVCPECIVTASPKLDRAAYIARAEATGELLPGLETVVARESVSIKFPGLPEATAG